MSDNSAALRRHPAGFRLRRELRVLKTSPATRVGRPDLLAEYEAHLEHSSLASSTRVAYRRQSPGYLDWLARCPEGIGDALTGPHARDVAVRDYRSSLKERRLGPASLNAALAAIDHLYRFLRLGLPSVRREALPAQAPRSLCAAELAGHRSLDTTRRYALPTQADLAAAVERSTIET